MLKPIIVTLVLTISIIFTPAFSQKNSCETVISERLTLLTQLLSNNDLEQIESILTEIEASCDVSEFTQRMRIISLMIQKKSTHTAIATYQHNSLDDVLIDRLEYATNSNYQAIYQKNKKKFDFVPLKHAIDSLIQLKASALLGSEAYTLNDNETSLALLFSDHIQSYVSRTGKEAPHVMINQKRHVHAYEIRKNDESFTVSGGIYSPLNATNPIIGINQVYGISYMGELTDQWVSEIFLKVRINKNDRDFDYLLYNEAHTVNSGASWIIGLSGGYKLVDLGKFISLARIGAAYESMSTGLSERGEYYDGFGRSTAYKKRYNIRTVNLIGGISILQHVFNGRFVGVNANYHYSPYSLDRRLLTKISPHYVSMEFFVRF